MLISLKFHKLIMLKNVSLWILMLKICIIFGKNQVAKNLIIINPEHGGKDSGESGINRIQEKVWF